MLKEQEKINYILELLYGDRAGESLNIIEAMVNRYRDETHRQHTSLSQKDCMLITYGDTIYEQGRAGLDVLREFLCRYVGDHLSAVHLLPFYPYSSDDGFSVIDYRSVRDDLGDWTNVKDLAKDYDLMFDAVINHISSKSDWFQGYLAGNKTYQNYFIECDDTQDYSQVVRPRALPLLTEFDTAEGKRKVWTTFSADQIDLNYQDPTLLHEILDILLLYAHRGARYIRLDAIGFLWKEIGTTCMHHDITHQVIRLMRLVIEEVTDNVVIITETNTPHEENISYFGNGDEAHMVYQFSLPPLTLHAFIEGDSTELLRWLEGISNVTDNTTYFNFLASHDGIGLRPLEGILDDDAINTMVLRVIERGGRVSYRDLDDGSKKPYELNINYLDAICESDLDEDTKARKFMASQAILLSVIGVPGIYIHSLLGSRNDIVGVETSGINRRINRERLRKEELFMTLDDDKNLRAKVLNLYLQLLAIRREHPAFSPKATQEVMHLDKRLFSIRRQNREEAEAIDVIINLSNDEVTIEGKGFDLITQCRLPDRYTVQPYEVIWKQVSMDM